MNTQEIKKNLEHAGEYAKELKIDEWDFILKRSKSLSLSSQNGEIEKQNSSLTQCFGVRVIHKNKVAIAYSEKSDIDSLKKVIREAYENSQFSDTNENQKITLENKEELVFSLQDQLKAQSPTLTQKKELSLFLETEVKKHDPRVVGAPYNGYGDSYIENYYLNSLGKFCASEDQSYYCYTSALLKEQKQSSSFHHISAGKTFDELNPKECVEKSLFHSKNWLKPKKLKTGTYSVTLTTDTLHELLSAFIGAFSGKSAQRKTTPLFEKLGSPVFNEKITLIDQPELHGGIHKYYFDDEGYLCQPLTLIDQGVLKSFYHNTETADFFKTKTTTHASRGPKTALSVSPHFLSIQKGATPESEILNQDFLEIYHLAGVHSGTNMVTGDFSVGVKGYTWKNGKVDTPVADITLSGNFYKMLNEHVGLVGNQCSLDSHKNFSAPKILFTEMSVAGG